jgi:hypothetical protein
VFRAWWRYGKSEFIGDIQTEDVTKEAYDQLYNGTRDLGSRFFSAAPRLICEKLAAAFTSEPARRQQEHDERIKRVQTERENSTAQENAFGKCCAALQVMLSFRTSRVFKENPTFGYDSSYDGSAATAANWKTFRSRVYPQRPIQVFAAKVLGTSFGRTLSGMPAEFATDAIITIDARELSTTRAGHAAVAVVCSNTMYVYNPQTTLDMELFRTIVATCRGVDKVQQMEPGPLIHLPSNSTEGICDALCSVFISVAMCGCADSWDTAMQELCSDKLIPYQQSVGCAIVTGVYNSRTCVPLDIARSIKDTLPDGLGYSMILKDGGALASLAAVTYESCYPVRVAIRARKRRIAVIDASARHIANVVIAPFALATFTDCATCSMY